MSTMQALMFHGPHDVRVEEVPRPEIEEPADVLLRVDRAAICGTDLHPYSGRMELEDGVVLGHEYLGTIEAKGDGVTQFEEGDRVVGSFFVACGKCWFCRRGTPMKCIGIRVFGMGFAMGDLQGAQSEYVRVPEADLTLRKIPEDGGLGDEDMLFVGDILTTGYDAVRKTEMRPGDVVAVVGCGPVGLCTVMAARALGAGKVVAVDMVPERLKLAASLGAIAVNPNEQDADDVVLELTDWRGADLVVDAVGNEHALAACFPLVRMGGTISLPGMYVEDSAPLPIGDMWLKNITIMAGVANIQGHMDEVIELIRDGRIDPKVIISHRMPLSEAAEGYRLFEEKEALKVVLDPTK
jgi:2-desacetyl-2-hydroxyethyl bacteriochlorophyllide A dehydrogenase